MQTLHEFESGQADPPQAASDADVDEIELPDVPWHDVSDDPIVSSWCVQAASAEASDDERLQLEPQPDAKSARMSHCAVIQRADAAGALHYAPTRSPAPSRAWQVLRRASLAVFFLAAGAFVVAWGWRTAHRAQRWHHHRQLMSYAQPADRVVLDTRDSTAPPGVAHPTALAAIGAAHERFAFVHGRCGPAGEKRLVSVTVVANEAAAMLYLAARCEPPAPLWLARPQRITSSDAQIALPSRAGGETARLQVFAGQPDPHDPSHFTIGYAFNDRRGTIDGWLLDRDAVKLEIRDGPLRTN